MSRTGKLAHCDDRNPGFGCRFDAAAVYPSVDDLPVRADGVVVHDRGSVVNDVHLVRRHRTSNDMPIRKVRRRDEREMRGREAEAELGSDWSAAKCPADPHPEVCARRERRPAAVIGRTPPGDP
jgi:hypothetical protein